MRGRAFDEGTPVPVKTTHPFGVTAMDTFLSPITSYRASGFLQSTLLPDTFFSGLNPNDLLSIEKEPVSLGKPDGPTRKYHWSSCMDDP